MLVAVDSILSDSEKLLTTSAPPVIRVTSKLEYSTKIETENGTQLQLFEIKRFRSGSCRCWKFVI